MAEKKTTAKKSAPAKGKAKAARVVKDAQALQTEIAEKRADYLEAKKSHLAGELINPRVLTHTRKEIARLETALTAARKSEKESK